jgi:hypothetical protein
MKMKFNCQISIFLFSGIQRICIFSEIRNTQTRSNIKRVSVFRNQYEQNFYFLEVPYFFRFTRKCVSLRIGKNLYFRLIIVFFRQNEIHTHKSFSDHFETLHFGQFETRHFGQQQCTPYTIQGYN